MNDIKEFIKGKRLAGIDYGLKRVGFSICDEFHITVTPKNTFQRQSDYFWRDFLEAVRSNNVGALVVGVPFGYEERKSNIAKDVMKFIEELKKRTDLKIIPFDESFSSYEAMNTMIKIGKKKKKRAVKETKDMIAAAVILRSFLQEIEG